MQDSNYSTTNADSLRSLDSSIAYLQTFKFFSVVKSRTIPKWSMFMSFFGFNSQSNQKVIEIFSMSASLWVKNCYKN